MSPASKKTIDRLLWLARTGKPKERLEATKTLMTLMDGDE